MAKPSRKNQHKVSFDEFTSVEKYTHRLYIEHIGQSKKIEKPEAKTSLFDKLSSFADKTYFIIS
jgi:hypothetical protein